MKRKFIIISASIIIVLIAAFFIIKPKKVDVKKINIETAIAKLGTINKTVTATGTLQAIITVDVGTQVSGKVEKIYADFNSYVKKGELLARLDTTNLAAAMDQSQANLDNAKAELDYHQANYNRLEPLNNKKLISQLEFDQTVYNLNKAKAGYSSALAQHKRDKINLDYASIYSPIDGIVLNRAVEEGQTVAASFNTPTLFTIANDLTQMRVEANVDEADIGQVKQGQRVEFNVDAYPNSNFDGAVTEVRLEPIITNNVVTYTIIISAPNPDFKLMPGMTAETNIYVLEKKDLLVVPSKALRFTPDQKLLMSYMNAQPNTGMKPNEDSNIQTVGTTGVNGTKIVWIKADSTIRSQTVKTGLDDDINVEITEGLKPGEEVILSMKENNVGMNEGVTTNRNPFMPHPPKK